MPVLFASVLVIMGSFAMLLPAIMYVLGNMGLSNSLSTPIIAAYSLAQFLAGPQWGRLSDRLGRKKVLATALFMGALSYTAMAVFAGSTIALFLTMVCAGLCAGSLAVVFATVSDITTPENRTKGMGVIGAAIGLSFVVGTAIGGSIAGDSAGSASIFGPASAAALVCLLGSAMVVFLMKETRHPITAEQGAEGDSASRIAAFQKIARHPVLLKLCFLILAFTFCLALMEPLVPKYILVHFDWGPIEMRNIFIYIGVTLVIVQGTLVGPLANRFGEVMLVRVGLGLMGGGLIILAVLPEPLFLVIALTLTSVGTALFNASALSLASHQAQDNERGAVMGVAQSMQALGRSFGPMVTGLLFDLNVGLPFMTGAVLVAVLLLSFQRLTRRLRAENP